MRSVFLSGYKIFQWALVQTKKGEFGLLTIYPGMTIIELNDRCGMVLEKKTAER